MGTWMLMSDYTQLALSEFDHLGERFIPVSYYCAAWAYNFSRGKRWHFTEADVVRWIEQMTTVEAQKILDTMLKSRVGGESLIDLIERADEDVKKKSGPVTSGIMP